MEALLVEEVPLEIGNSNVTRYRKKMRVFLYKTLKVIGDKMKNKFSLKKLICITLFEVFFITITSPLIIFYGPFQELKSTVVGSLITTFKHQYLVKMFLKEDKINEILKSNVITYNEQKNLGQIEDNIKEKFNKDEEVTKLKMLKIKSERFNGYAILIDNPLKVKIGYSIQNNEGETTSSLAKKYNALAAINGGGFSYFIRDKMLISKGGNPSNLIISSGNIVYKSGIEDDTKISIMGITNNGVLIAGKHSINELKKMDVQEAISFGPPLVINGTGTIKSGDGGWGIAPRTCIGQRKDGTIIFLVIDGRQPGYSYGATLRDAQDVMIKLNAYNAVNLDGGNSSTMYYNGKVINNPCSPTGERVVPSIVYVE